MTTNDMDRDDLVALALAQLTAHSFDARDLHMHYDHATQAWWMVTGDDLVAFGRMLAAEVPDAYSHWCAQTGSTAVDAMRVVRDYDADETTDLDALRDEAGAADDMVSYMALVFLRDEVEEIIAMDAEIEGEAA